MTYYLKALALIALHPVAIARHPHGGRKLLGQVARRQFRLHWIRTMIADEAGR